MRVLITDDEPGLRRTLAIGLRANGYDALTAGDGRTALQACREDSPDLVILDLGLPDGSGLELLADLDDGNGPPVPAIVYSAQDMDAALGDKVEAVLVKSRTSLANLTRTVRRLTSKRSAQ